MFSRGLLTAACLGLAALMAGGSDAAAAGAAEGEQRWRFRVLLDEREIGFHDYVVTRENNRARVETVAQFDVRILFINAYRYRHRNVELWEDGCLSSIQAETDDNGDRLQVAGAPSDSGFRVGSASGEATLSSSCVQTFAYWNPDVLGATQLLNSQTGEWVDVAIEEVGSDNVRYGALDIPARRVRIAMPAGRIDLWYERESGRWLALESPTEGGRLLRYEPVELPRAIPEPRLTLN